MSDDIKENILSASQWVRILYMVFFAVACWVLGIVMTVLVIAQALFSLITGRDNENLRQFGSSLSLYFYQILLFLVYDSEVKPFPFSEFPVAGIAASAETTDLAEDETLDETDDEVVTGVSDEDDVFADISFTEARGTEGLDAGEEEIPGSYETDMDADDDYDSRKKKSEDSE